MRRLAAAGSWAAIGLMAACLAGCSNDPENSILEPGTQAVVAGTEGAFLEVPGEISPELLPGVRVTVGHDSGVLIRDKDQTRAEYPDKSAQYRKIKVTVETGPNAGKSGLMYRNDLRPIGK